MEKSEAKSNFCQHFSSGTECTVLENTVVSHAIKEVAKTSTSNKTFLYGLQQILLLSAHCIDTVFFSCDQTSESHPNSTLFRHFIEILRCKLYGNNPSLLSLQFQNLSTYCGGPLHLQQAPLSCRKMQAVKKPASPPSSPFLKSQILTSSVKESQRVGGRRTYTFIGVVK